MRDAWRSVVPVRRSAAVVAGALVLAGGLAACSSSSSTTPTNSVDVQLTNATASAELNIIMYHRGQNYGPYDLKPIGGFSTWTIVPLDVGVGDSLHFRVTQDPSNSFVSEGYCKVAPDAATLEYTRIIVQPEVACSCGFVGSIEGACSP